MENFTAEQTKKILDALEPSTYWFVTYELPGGESAWVRDERGYHHIDGGPEHLLELGFNEHCPADAKAVFNSLPEEEACHIDSMASELGIHISWYPSKEKALLDEGGQWINEHFTQCKAEKAVLSAAKAKD